MLYSDLDEFARCFVTDKRDDGSEFWKRKDSSPDWANDACFAAHGGQFPNDWRYSFIAHLADALRDWASDSHNPDDELDFGGFDAHETVDSLVDVYMSELTAWLNSRVDRYCYIDEARDEGLIPDDADEIKRLQIGQYQEISETCYLLINFLTEN